MSTSASTETTRTIPGVDLPPAGAYQIDPAHTDVEFVARHLGISKVRGRFAAFSGTVEIAEDPLVSSVEVTIEAASIDTRSEDRDAHLRSGDFLDVEAHPHLTFRSTGVRHTRGDRFEVDGELTVRGVTRPVTLDVQYLGTARDPWGGDRIAFTASTELDREAFGLTWNQALETGGVLVGKKVRIELDVQAVRS